MTRAQYARALRARAQRRAFLARRAALQRAAQRRALAQRRPPPRKQPDVVDRLVDYGVAKAKGAVVGAAQNAVVDLATGLIEDVAPAVPAAIATAAGAIPAAVAAAASVAIPLGVAGMFAYGILDLAGVVGKSSAQMLAEARAYADTSLFDAGMRGEKIREVDDTPVRRVR